LIILFIRDLIMKILLTGASGYIGTRLLPLLLDEGHEVFALVRREKHFVLSKDQLSRLTLIIGNLIDKSSLEAIPENLDGAYYLVHSMSENADEFNKLELECATNFASVMQKRKLKQIIYLSGMSHGKD